MKATWVLLVVTLVGCTTSGGYVPVTPIEMKKGMVNDFQAPTPIHVEPIEGRGAISKKFHHKGKIVPALFDLDEMTLFIANSLSAELVKKGATPNIEANKIIRVKVVDVDISYSTNYSVTGSLEFQLSNGYSGSRSFGSTGVKASRALGGALQWGVANVLNHSKVQSFLLEKDTLSQQKFQEPEDEPVVPSRIEEAEYKLAIMPFQAREFYRDDKFIKRAIEALIESTNEFKDIVLTYSDYKYRDYFLERNKIAKIDYTTVNIDKKDIWTKKLGNYSLNKDVITQLGSAINIDLIFACKVYCRSVSNCQRLLIDMYLYSVADNKMFHKKINIHNYKHGEYSTYVHDHYSDDHFYLEIKKLSAVLFKEFLNHKKYLPQKKSLTLQ